MDINASVLCFVRTVEPEPLTGRSDQFVLHLYKLINATTLTEVHAQMDKMQVLITVSGCTRPVLQVTQRDALVKDLVEFYVLTRVSACTDQLKRGLQTLGVLDEIQRHPKCIQELFIMATNQPLTAGIIEATFHEVVFSEEGSNQRGQESRTICYWSGFLIDLEDGEDGLPLQDVLVFATGADVVPPLGFDPEPSIEFTHGPYPLANTCAMMLRLPMATPYCTFKANMVFGISNAPGFGMA